nr:phosphatase PAP2 family protein [Candidatus Sigynarchaeota archaeon]
MHIKPLYLVLLLGAIGVGVMTLVFYFTDLDLAITSYYYDPVGTVRFPIGNMEPWHWLYEEVDIFLYVLVAIIITMLVMGLVKRRFRPFLVYALFMFLAYIIGPGLIANVLLKGTEIGDFYIGWSRPRPREIIQFGGTEQFYRIWEPAFLDGLTYDNSSFPCGHALSGTIFIVIFFVFNNVDFIAEMLGGKTKARVALINAFKYGGLMAAIVVGFLLSIARISQGAHFASDCMYSFVFTWLPAAVLYYWVFQIPKKERRVMDKLVATKQ